MADDIEARTIERVAWRFIPFLILCYFVAYLDRVNVGFAKLTMDADLGLSETAFGFGAGVFFLAYFLFEVPSNIILDKVGARRWIARIMLSWGVDLGRDGLHPRNRPGDWPQRRTHVLPPAHPARLRRGRVLSRHHLFPDPVVPGLLPGAHRRLFHGGDPALLGDRLAGLRRRCSASTASSGLRGWQWLFVVEALPSIVLGVVTFFYLTDRPADANWLDADEPRGWLQRRLAPRGPAARARLARRARSRASPTRACWRFRSSISAPSPASTASASGCRRSSRASACRSR